MECLIAVLMLVAGDATVASGETELKRFEFTEVQMAVPVKLVLYAPDASAANLAAKSAFAEIGRLNQIFSDYDPKSEQRRLFDDTTEGVAVTVSHDLWQVLKHSQALSRRTNGAFDVTVGPVVKLWRRARRQGKLPLPDRLDSARKLVGYRYVRLIQKQRSVELEKSGMRLDFGGIAKGYAGDMALKVLNKSGIKSALIDFGGDVILGDPPPRRKGWRIAIAALEAGGKPSRFLTLANAAIATSGDTWQFVKIDGRRYSHIVDPRTGLGLTDHSSVTVIAPTGMAADSLASAVSVLGPDKGLKLIEDTADTSVLIIRKPDDSKLQEHKSSRWPTGGGERVP
jgi:thiamine biosynthesis lipoprotein